MSSYKHLLCPEACGNNIVNKYGNIFKDLRQCSDPQCKSAHSFEELETLKTIKDYQDLNKKEYDWCSLFDAIVNVLEKDGLRVKSINHMPILSIVYKLNFFDTIRTWRIMACYYRKLANNFNPEKDNEIKNLEDIPRFELPAKYEDIAWNLSRCTIICPVFNNFKNILETARPNSVSIRSCCLATGLNCKNGIHNLNEKICEQDFLCGKCSCITITDFNDKILKIKRKIEETKIKLVDYIKEESEQKIKEEETFDGFVSPKNNKQKKRQEKNSTKVKLADKIKQYEKKLTDTIESRLIHYTELGMKPFESQYKKFIEEKEKSRISEQPFEINTTRLKTKPVIKIKLGK